MLKARPLVTFVEHSEKLRSESSPSATPWLGLCVAF